MSRHDAIKALARMDNPGLFETPIDQRRTKALQDAALPKVQRDILRRGPHRG